MSDDFYKYFRGYLLEEVLPFSLLVPEHRHLWRLLVTVPGSPSVWHVRCAVCGRWDEIANYALWRPEVVNVMRKKVRRRARE